MKTYTALSQIGLLAGTATIEQIYNALTDGSEIIEQVGDLANLGYCPYSDSIIRITRFNANRGSIESYSKESNAQCFLAVTNRSNPNGKWQELVSNSKFKSIGINNNETTTIDLGGYAHIAMIMRNDKQVMIGYEYWTQNYWIIAGSIPAGITITKAANSTSITIQNTTGSAIGVCAV